MQVNLTKLRRKEDNVLVVFTHGRIYSKGKCYNVRTSQCEDVIVGLVRIHPESGTDILVSYVLIVPFDDSILEQKITSHHSPMSKF